jgi:hypothetical protein
MHNRLSGQEIADTNLGEDVTPVDRIRLQFVPEAVHVHLEHVAFTDVFCSPDMP